MTQVFPKLILIFSLFVGLSTPCPLAYFVPSEQSAETEPLEREEVTVRSGVMRLQRLRTSGPNFDNFARRFNSLADLGNSAARPTKSPPARQTPGRHLYQQLAVFRI